MIITKIAAQLGVCCQNINNESICHFPSDFGSGYLKSSYYPSGIEVVEIKGILSKPLKINFLKEESFRLNMIFNH